MKELLKITDIKEGVTATECHVETEREMLVLMASLIGAMEKLPMLAKAVAGAAHVRAMDPQWAKELTRMMTRSAEIKTTN